MKSEMKKNVTFIFLNLIVFVVMGQSNTRINNYWINSGYVNPASLNEQSPGEFSAVARKQWFGVEGAPSTIYANGSVYVDKLKTEFGIKVLSDNIGFTQKTNIAFSYSYNLQLDYLWKLHFGIAPTYQNVSYDIAKIQSDKVETGSFYNNLLTTSNYNCDLGIELLNRFMTIGLVSQNLTTLFYKENELQVNTNMLYATYQANNDNMVELRYGASAIQYSSILQFEFSLISYFKYYQMPEVFQMGMFYRTMNEMGVILGFNLTKQLHLWYSYDFNVGGLSRSSIGTNEIMLVYNLPKKCPNCDTWRGR